MAFLALALIALGACRPGAVEGQSEGTAATADEQSRNRVIFPQDREVDDPVVNQFMLDALDASARGDYEGFRLLWSARQAPLRREEFEQGWRAVRTIRVRAIEKVLISDDKAGSRTADAARDGEGAPPGEEDISYVLLAEAEFDPNHPVGQRESRRDFVLLVTREEGQWRLGRAPPQVRNWLRNRADLPPDADLEEP